MHALALAMCTAVSPKVPHLPCPLLGFMTATTCGGACLPCHAAAWRTVCTSAVASLPLAHTNGSVLCSLNLGEGPVLLLLLLFVMGLAGVKYHTLKLLGLSRAAPTTCHPDICISCAGQPKGNI